MAKKTERGVISDKELERLFTKLYKLKRIFSDEDFQKIIGQASKPAEDAMKNEAPINRKAYKPGRLRNSIQTFQAKRQRSSTVIVGPVFNPKSAIKSVKGIKRISRRKNAYYASIVNSGGQRGFESSGFVNVPPNRYVRRAARSSKSAVTIKFK